MLCKQTGFKTHQLVFCSAGQVFLLANLIKHHREPLFCIKFYIHPYINSKQYTFWTGASHKYFCHRLFVTLTLILILYQLFYKENE